MKQILTYFTKRYLPRWLVLFSDLLIVDFSFILAFLLRFNFNIQPVKASFEYAQLSIVFPVVLFCFWKSKSFSGILRHSTMNDVMRIINSMFCAGIMLIIVSLAGRYLQFPSFLIIPLSVIAIMVTVASTLLVLSRLLAKLLFRVLKNKNGESLKRVQFSYYAHFL